MTTKTPARLHKKEPLTITYNKTTVYLIGALFMFLLVIVAFKFGSDSFNFLLRSYI